MKKMSKVLVASMAALAFGASAFAEVSLSAKNRVTSGIVSVIAAEGAETSVVPGMPLDDGTGTKVLEEKATVEFTSDRVDAMIKGVTNLNIKKTEAAPGEDAKSYLALGEEGFAAADWYIEFRPFTGKYDILTVGLHDAIMIEGSYLPVFDDNLSGGNLGSDFVLCFRPIKGMRLTAGMDFEADFGLNTPVVNAGIDYSYKDWGSAGVTFRNLAGKNDEGKWDSTVGVFISTPKVPGLLTLNLGYTHNAQDDVKLTGEVVSLGATCAVKKIGFGAGLDFASTFGNTTNAYDMYFGVAPKMFLSKTLAVGCAYKAYADYDKALKSTQTVAPFVDIMVGGHKIELCAAYTYAGPKSTHIVTFPCYWEYKF